MMLVLYALLEHILSFGCLNIIQLYVMFSPSLLGNQLFLWGTLAFSVEIAFSHQNWQRLMLGVLGCCFCQTGSFIVTPERSSDISTQAHCLPACSALATDHAAYLFICSGLVVRL